MKTIIKKRRNTLLLTLALLVGMTTAAIAQGPGYNKNAKSEDGQRFCKNIPNLTTDQEQKIEQLRTKQIKKMTSLKNQMKLKHAELQLLQTAEKVDMKSANAKIDEITNIKSELMKNGAAHKQEIRKILTEEQRVYFDAHGAKGKGNGRAGSCDGHRGQGSGGSGHFRNCPNK